MEEEIIEQVKPVEPAETPVEPEKTGEEKTPPPGEEKNEEKQVPLKALEDERRKRQLEAEEKEYWKQQALKQPKQEERQVLAPSGLPPKPTREEFYNEVDPEAAFMEAMADWKAEEKLAQRDQQAQQAAVQTKIQTAAQKFFSAGHQKYEDFDAVATYNPDLIVTPAMQEALIDSEHGADVAYYLGKNLTEARRIAGLPPVAQVREIGKIEAKLQTAETPPKRTTQAPEPIKPVETKGNTSAKDPSQMSDAEFSAYRKRQIAQRRYRES